MSRESEVRAGGVSRAYVAIVGVVVSLTAFACFGGAALAATPAGGLTVHSFPMLGQFSPAKDAECEAHFEDRLPLCDAYQITVTNAGSVTSEGPIKVTDLLPPGMVVKRVQFFWSAQIGTDHFNLCEPAAVPVECTFPIGLQPDQSLEMFVFVTVDPNAPTGQKNVVRATGESSPEAVVEEEDIVGSQPLSFGTNAFVSYLAGLDGAPDTQAGDHPYEYSTRIDFNNVIRSSPTGQVQPTSVQDVRDVVVDLPVGLVGSAVATPRCMLAQLASVAGCPADTAIGHIITEPESAASVNSQIFNMVPEHGVAAEFGFTDVLDNTHVIYSSIVPTPAGYVLRATSPEVSEAPLTDVVASFFGNPALKDGTTNTPVAMFTNPSDCSGSALVTSVHMDSWHAPGRFNADGTPDLSDPNWVSSTSESPAVTGCNRLQFATEGFSLQPETSAADASTGLSFDLRMQQSETPGTLAAPPLRNASVTLPAGLIVNPAAAGGLASCSTTQIGWLGRSLSDFTPAPPTCPDASKIGSVEVTSPALASTLSGTVYLAAQNDNPFHSLLAGYIVIDDSTTGIIAKIPGRLTLDPSTGQITGIFDENPQFPVSELKLSFYGGPRGELATPESCGTFTSTGLLSPWSAPDSGPATSIADSFQITTGCTPGFAPAFTAGTTSPHAGGFSPFVLSFSRQDSEQEISALTVSLPPGLLAKLAGVEKCSETALSAAAARQSGAAEQTSPSCLAASQLGSVQAGAGAGSSPFFLGGKAYLTGPYKGAPYGIAVIVPAVAGPIDLGNVVVRSQLRVDPTDAHATIISDPFPTILDAKGADGQTDGFPVRMRRVDITVDRPGFTLNPTSCTPMAIAASFSSVGGQTSSTSARFQAGGCRELPFKPRFSASTQARTSKAGGASLHIHVSSTSGQAGIAKVKVALPKQLPSRLTTLQKACIDQVFSANPASCPQASLVGMATITTPLLANPLSGPAYLVSHGGAAFPDVEILLQGEGITLLLDGHTNIKHGITTSSFNALPDAPFTSFDTTFPEGPHSVLAAFLPPKAKGSTCNQHLTMPTVIVAQNGAVIRQSTPISASGCPKHQSKRLKHKRKK